MPETPDSLPDPRFSSAGSPLPVTRSLRAPLPRRYRVAMATLAVLAGIGFGVIVAAQPFTPFTLSALLVSVVVGVVLGFVGYRALEHSLE